MKTKCFNTLPKISNDALGAIKIGVKENHSISNLEQLGVKQRLINLLELNGVTDLGHLLSLKKEALLSFPNFGEKQLFSIFEALSKYHTI